MLGADARSELEAHLTGCAECRQLRVGLAESAAAWRATAAKVRVPDERLEWQRVRRRLNGEPERAAPRARGIFTLGRSATLLAAAAAVVLGLFLSPSLRPPKVTVAAAAPVADFVEVGGDASSAMVYVDDKSGWLVVWAADTAEKAGG